MNKRLLILVPVFVAFFTYSNYAVYHYGYLGLWKLGFTSIGNFQILADLMIACCIICSWMIGDSRARQKKVWFWILLTVLTGTIGILLYLIFRELDKAKQQEQP